MSQEKVKELTKDIQRRIKSTNRWLSANKSIGNPEGEAFRQIEIYELALAALTQPASAALKLPDAQEKVIGVWSPSTNEIAVSKLSGIKVVDFAHWHCHCTKEVVIRDIAEHPSLPAAPHTAHIEPSCATGRTMPRDEFNELVGKLAARNYGTSVDIADVLCAFNIKPERPE